ncbi:MAG: hypothetical protein M3265_06630 [Actinomycetota bacterium]|jgi:hypothetical protein|nr:hypothetical protein [Actinomycetota bacterium]
MASLNDATAVTSQVTDLTSELHSQLTEGDVDFGRMVDLADAISERADELAAALSAVNEALEARFDGTSSQ